MAAASPPPAADAPTRAGWLLAPAADPPIAANLHRRTTQTAAPG